MSDTSFGGQSIGIAFMLLCVHLPAQESRKKKATKIQNRVKGERVLKTQTFCSEHPLHKISL